MRILYAASEAAPFAKSGGLADVAGALPKALVKVASETITDPKFYDRFFALIDRYRVFSERADARADSTAAAAD